MIDFLRFPPLFFSSSSAATASFGVASISDSEVIAGSSLAAGA
jgi:hypothetical protein